MKTKIWIIAIGIVAIVILGIVIYYYFQGQSKSCSTCGNVAPTSSPQESNLLPEGQARIIFLHHSTGQVIWDGGVAEWFEDYNINNGTNYAISEEAFPKDSPYGWNNYPYDYYNIWVKNGEGLEYMEEPTLNSLTKDYNVIIFKHCFPVSEIEIDSGSGNIDSEEKTIANYKLQYNMLKEKMHQYKNNKFIIWTGAVETQGVLADGPANRMKIFVDWVKNEWDEKGDNIYIFDFYNFETDGGLYLKNEYAANFDDSHPNESFAKRIAPIFSQRIIDVIEGKRDE